jgi:hypothetical protein
MPPILPKFAAFIRDLRGKGPENPRPYREGRTMSVIRNLSLIPLLALLAGCVTTAETSRNLTPPLTAPLMAPDLAPGAAPIAVAARAEALSLSSLEILVPRQLSVSEANTFLPQADIVWRGDPLGDRHAQVASIFHSAAMAAGADLADGRPVAMTIEVTRFHGLTEKARFVTGGNYAMQFILTLRDAETGAVLVGPREVVADLKAWGAETAAQQEAAGISQKMLVTGRLAEVLRQELAYPAYSAAL